MFNATTINQFNLLVVCTFSFLIFVFTLCLNKEKSFFRILGAAFFAPFLLSAIALLSEERVYRDVLFILAELNLLLFLLILLILLPFKGMYNLLYFSLIALPAVLVPLASSGSQFQNAVISPVIHTPLFILISIIILYLLQKEKGAKGKLFWSILILLACVILKDMANSIITAVFISLLRVTAYTQIFHFIYKETYGKILSRIAASEKKLNTLNRSIELEVKKRIFEIERSNEKLKNTSRIDALTKVLNKTAILSVLEALTSSAATKEFSIIMFDIDNFKTINDTLGHITGDKCLKNLATLAGQCIRDTDSIGRYGGDEFIIILPNSNISHAKLIAERLAKKVDTTSNPHFTISIGIASFPHDGFTVKELIASADEGMYVSKRRGKNTVSHKNLY